MHFKSRLQFIEFFAFVLTDSVIYTQTIDLTVSAKDLEITFNNSDYQRIAQ